MSSVACVLLANAQNLEPRTWNPNLEPRTQNQGTQNQNPEPRTQNQEPGFCQ
jgi:hypothetical protein